MKNQNLLIALAILVVVGIVSFTFLMRSYNPEGFDQEPLAGEFVMPQLTEQEVEKLGPKNHLAALDWLPSNGMFGYIAHPKRLLESPLLVEGGDLLADRLAGITMLPFDMTKVELLLNCTTIRQVMIPAQPGQPVMPQVRPIPFVCNYVQLTQPLDKQAILGEFVPPNSGPRMRSIAGKEVYDLPSGYPITAHAVVFLDEKALLHIMGDEEWLQDSLNGKAPTGPLAQRMGRAKIDDSDLVIVGSAEAGLPEFPPELISVLSQDNGIPETLIKLLLENFRAVQLTLNLSAPEKEPLLTLKIETLKPEGAKEIAKVVNEQIVFYRSSLRLLQPRATEEHSLIATGAGDDWQKLGNQILDSIDISAQDVVISATLKHFPALGTYFSVFFQDQRQQLARMEEEYRLRMTLDSIAQRVSTIRRYMIEYHNEKGEFPPAAICDAEGTPLLSWRVAILPYMGESGKELYSQFNREEPWDGPTNRPLIGKMPPIFGDVRAYDPTQTTVRMFNSEGTPFGRPTLKMTDILGPQTTVMLVVVSPENAVEWTRPDTLVPCESVEGYIKLFGPMVPILLFNGSNTAIPFGLVPESDHPKVLEQLKNMIEGKPVQ